MLLLSMKKIYALNLLVGVLAVLELGGYLECLRIGREGLRDLHLSLKV